MSRKFITVRDFDKKFTMLDHPDLPEDTENCYECGGAPVPKMSKISNDAVAVIRMIDYKIMAICPSMHEALTVAGALDEMTGSDVMKPELSYRKYIRNDSDYDEMVSVLGGLLQEIDEAEANIVNSMLQEYEAKRWPDQYSAVLEGVGGI